MTVAAHGRRAQARAKPAPTARTLANEDDTNVSLNAQHWRALRHIAPFMWPPGRPDLRFRVVAALIAMILSKAVTVTIPFFYGGAVDALSATNTAAFWTSSLFFFVIAYGFARFLSGAFQQLRDAIIVKVSQYAQAQVSVETFRHLHALSLRYHLERRTGGLSRYIERGTRAIDFLLRWLIFNIVPTLIELILVCAIMATVFSPTYAAITAVTVVCYIWFTFSVTEWRTKFYREMIAQDAETGSKGRRQSSQFRDGQILQ